MARSNVQIGTGSVRGTQPALVDVARLAGVSEATASRVLANSRHVGQEFRDRVFASAAKLDYRPNPHARALARSRDDSVGVVVHDVGDPYFSEIVRGVLHGARTSGRKLFLCDTYRDAERELAYIQHFRAQRVEALLLAGSGHLDREIGARISNEIASFEGTGGRAVVIGRHEGAADTLLPDNYEGARQLAHHLADLGHSRIGVISGPEVLTATYDRLTGFQAGLAERKIRFDAKCIRPGEFRRSDGERATHELLDDCADITALFAMNDMMASGALAAARSRHLRVPEDISIAGFDDIPMAIELSPSLTTVRLPMEAIGERAFDFLTDERPANFRTVRFATQLVVRTSTGPPRA